MQGHFWHLFLTQLFMLFHMVASVLLSMVAFSTIFLLVKILQQPIRIFEISGYWSCHGEENACYHVKEHKKLGQKLVSKVTLHFVWGHLPKKQTVVSYCPPCLPYSWNLKPITEKSRLSSIFVTQEKNDLDQLFSMQKFFIHRNVLARRFFVLLLFIVC